MPIPLDGKLLDRAYKSSQSQTPNKETLMKGNTCMAKEIRKMRYCKFLE